MSRLSQSSAAIACLRERSNLSNNRHLFEKSLIMNSDTKFRSGQILIENAAEEDELVFVEKFGTLNITKAYNMVPAIFEPLTHPIDATLLYHIALRHRDEASIEKMTEERRNHPILMAAAQDGYHVIDGVHRIMARHRKGLTFVKFFTFAPISVEAIRVRAYRVAEDQSLVEVPTPHEQEVIAVRDGEH